MNEEIMERGRIAKSIADNLEFKKLIEEIKMDLFYQFSQTGVIDEEKKQEINLTMAGFNLLVKKINTYISLANFEAQKPSASD
ncbi:hypothetical protein AB3G45_19615 [Shinella sp. S4-D37]|uniref:hypothetical protein n=1 Tax=Shinella sp. S4-D37 TaxID=3161999 RepID=UPI0034652232